MQINKELKAKLISLLRVSSSNLIGVYIIFIILLIHGKLTLNVAIISVALITTITTIFFWPWIIDFFSLIDYVKKLTNDHKARAPSLNHVKIGDLSKAIYDLNSLLLNRQYELESKIIESNILFNILPDIIIMIDIDTIIINGNTNATNIFGKDIIGKNFKDIIDNELIYDHIKWVNHDKQTKSIEIFIEKFQKYFMFRIAKFPSNSSGKIASIIVMTDVTETKRTEQMFIDFVANASHEIRTPLSSIKGFVEILLTTGKDDIDCHEKFLTIISEQAERLNLLVKDLLSLSKLEFDNKTAYKEIDIISINKIAYDDLIFMMSEKHIIFKFEYLGDIPCIYGDRNQIIQVLTNLFSNAIKYSYDNSEVRIVIEKCVNNNICFEYNNKYWLRIQIIDQSEGIEKQHLPRLTERFYRVDSSRIRNSKIGGTGLGLSIVKQILCQHNGYLDITSTINSGSTFSVYLPLE